MRRYKTPKMADIDQVGIQPDSSCSISAPGEEGQEAASGMPVDKAAAASIATQLESDACVLTAESLLESQLVAMNAPALTAGAVLDTVAAQGQ